MPEVARGLTASPAAQKPFPAAQPATRFHQRVFAEELALRSGDATQRLAPTLSDAQVDLNPHQVEAAAFALDSLSRGGCMLADEVGLGKTIEAGIVIAQLLAEGKRRILIVCPATIRAQWQLELEEKFRIAARIVDGSALRSGANAFEQPGPVICSLPFGASHASSLGRVSWDLVVIDEAHRLRNAHRTSHKTGQALRTALKDRPKILLTATPLQNNLLELFGLMSLLDDQILGPEHAFRSRYQLASPAGALNEETTQELKNRLAGVVQRTLRRQVREYVRFTQRRSIVEDFAPTEEEQDLYQKVSDYLRRPDIAAIEPGRRTLLTLVYRKLLASSSHAIAPTLQKLADSLRQRLTSGLGGNAPPAFEPDEVLDFSEEAEEWADRPSTRGGLVAIEAEIAELERYASLASRIRLNAKGEALKRALDRTFTVARANQWPLKAVVFTESKRTQEYLFQLLGEGGYAGMISRLSGDAGSPAERAALIAEFRDRTRVLLSTEAGAEGLNLQFCNLVVNYDLPWNPQRIEQRIGRCHRYGQQRDVLVINFVNRRNAADARLFELLEKKLSLFDGVFGASDEILGVLESGVDFERRVLEIYQSCRLPEEIDAAFDALRAELEQRIDRRMLQTRTLLLERFDGDVRRRLRLEAERAREAVSRHRDRASALTSSLPGATGPSTRERLGQAAEVVRARGQDGVTFLRLDASRLPLNLAGLTGGEGWWFAYRFETTGLKPEETLGHLVLLKQGDGGYRALALSESELFLRLPAQEVRDCFPTGGSVASAQEQALISARQEIGRAAEARSWSQLDLARERADRFAEDSLMEARQAVERARLGWESGRLELQGESDPALRAKARARTERAEREYRRALAALRAQEDGCYAQKDRAMAALAQRAKVAESRRLIASAYFWLS